MGTTTTDLITNIRTRGSFPVNDATFTSSSYLSILNDEMLNKIVPLLMRVNQEYFLAYKDHAVTAGKSSYRIPARAVGQTLRNVQFIDSTGNYIDLPKLVEEDKYSETQGRVGYYLKGNQVLLHPTPTNTSGTLRLAYMRRPQKLVLSSASAKINSIDTINNQVVVDSLPSTITTSTNIDFVQSDSPYDLLNTDIAVTGVSGTTLSFTTLPDDLAVGDYVNVAGEACVPCIPEDLVPFLVQAALCICLSSKKDKSINNEMNKLEEMRLNLIDLLSPRTKSDDVVVFHGGLVNSFIRR